MYKRKCGICTNFDEKSLNCISSTRNVFTERVSIALTSDYICHELLVSLLELICSFVK